MKFIKLPKNDPKYWLCLMSEVEFKSIDFEPYTYDNVVTQYDVVGM